MYRTLLYILLVVLFAACTKPKPEGSTVTSFNKKIRLFNRLNKKVYIKMYTSREDYSRSANAYIDAVVPANSTGEIELTNGTGKFYLDWYSEDFKYTNWGAFVVDNRYEFEYKIEEVMADDDPMIFFTQDYHYGLARSIYVNGGEPRVEWTAIDHTDALTESNWNTLSDNEKYCKLFINKTMEFELHQKTPSGGTIVRDGICAPGTASAWVSLFLSFSVSEDDIMLANANPRTYKVTGDTVYMLDEGRNGYYVLVKKK